MASTTSTHSSSAGSSPFFPDGGCAGELPQYLAGESELRDFLESHGVSTSSFGQGEAKPLSRLLSELREQSCFLESSEEQLGPGSSSSTAAAPASRRRLLRVVEPVFIRLRWRGRVLVEETQRFPDGRTRQRKMLLAEKQMPSDGGGLFATVLRSLHEELGVPLEALKADSVLRFRPDTYHFEIEHIDSPSYPGLPSAYRTHHVQVDILETGLEVFQGCGLPSGADFETREVSPDGVVTHCWRWYDVNTALTHGGGVKWLPKALAANFQPLGASGAPPDRDKSGHRALSKEDIPDESTLAFFLEQAGIDSARFGVAKAKPLSALLKEVHKGESCLEWCETTASLRRVVEPVFVQFLWKGKVLVEKEQQFTDGRLRQRNMLLAEKRSPQDEDVELSAIRGLQEELDLFESMPDLTKYVRFMQEAYCCVAEELESESFPGLTCVYVTHYCGLELLDSGTQKFQELGMLSEEFETTEEDGKVNRWHWIPHEQARKQNVKGLPRLNKEAVSEKSEKSAEWERILSLPQDAHELRILLEMGGVNVSAWGTYAAQSLASLACEMATGAAHLERDTVSGRVRRVLKPSMVQVNVKDLKEETRSEVRSHEPVARQNSEKPETQKEAVAFRLEEPKRLTPQGHTGPQGPRELQGPQGPQGPQGVRLDSGLDYARSLVHFRHDLACWEVTQTNSLCYPGLACCHHTRLVQFCSGPEIRRTNNLRAALRAASPAAVSGLHFESLSPKAAVARSSARLSTMFGLLGDNLLSAGGQVEVLPACAGEECNPASPTRWCRSSVRSMGSDAESSDAGSLPVSPIRRLSRNHYSSRGSEEGFESPPVVGSRRSSRGSEAPSIDENKVTAAAQDEQESSKRMGLCGQLQSLESNLRFRMVAKEAIESAIPPAEHVVFCSCDILLIRNINPLNATYQCRFAVYLEWIDKAAKDMPEGEVSDADALKLTIPEIALQNTLKTGLEVHSKPQVVNPETGHVACKILYQALMQMELNMRLFPFDAQRLNLVLGLRARRDHGRVISCQFCHVHREIHLDEWNLLGSFSYADRPDGRARVQFGVIIGRAYWYYVVNVLITLVLIASASFAGYVLMPLPPYDRLRFGVSILFAQTTFRLSIENKLPKVAYATAFDHFAMFCQLLVLAILAGNVIVVVLSERWLSFGNEQLAINVDRAIYSLLLFTWIFGNLGFGSVVALRRKRQYKDLMQLSEKKVDHDHGTLTEEQGSSLELDFGPGALAQKALLRPSLWYNGLSGRAQRVSRAQASTHAVVVSIRVWLLHDIDPISAQYECKFSVYVEWLSDAAVGLPEAVLLSKEQLAALDPPELDVQNKVDLAVDDGPSACVTNSATGQVLMVIRYHAKLQLQLNLRRFPFDRQQLPINLTMPSAKDKDRAFVVRGADLTPLAQNLDEWIVEGQETGTDYMEGMAQASLVILIGRRSTFYVVSVLAVLLGLSTLVFTVFVIRVDRSTQGRGFADQGKVLVPLLMTMLAFKLLTSSGKIPKCAYATLMDRYILASESCLFITTFTVVCGRGLVGSGVVDYFQSYAAAVLLTFWFAFNLAIVMQVRRGNARTELALVQGPPHSTPSFESQQRSITAQPLQEKGGLMPQLGGDNTSSANAASQVVLLGLLMKHLHSVNAATATFACEFEVSLAWLAPGCGAELPSGEKLSEQQCKKFGQPKLTVQNALISKCTFLGGELLDKLTGHITCGLSFKTQIVMCLNLTNFPWDEQSLCVILTMQDPQDFHRTLVLGPCETDGDCAVKSGEWSEIGTFAKASRVGGLSQALFGVRLRRASRYYVSSLVSLCLWSTFIFLVYKLDVDKFADRGKIMVGVLLVQVVAKVAVSSKMPRVVMLTAYDRIALHSLALLFGIGIGAALCDALGQLNVVSFKALTRLDQAIGLLNFVGWSLMNGQVIAQVRCSKSKGDAVPEDVQRLLGPASLGSGGLPPKLMAEAEILRGPSTITPTATTATKLMAEDPAERQVSHRQPTQAAGENDRNQRSVSVGFKVWIVTDIDVSSATFECKFHVFMQWTDPTAIGMPADTRMSTQPGKDGKPLIVLPRLALKNTIALVLEEYSDVIVINGSTGQVACRIQYHARIYNEFHLRAFPFDCQRLEVTLELQKDCKGFWLVPSFCDGGDQRSNLDGWGLLQTSVRPVAGAKGGDQAQGVSLFMLVERESSYYVIHVLFIYLFLTTLMFSFYLLKVTDFTKRVVDILKIVLTQTAFRFSVEHRLPKAKQWTPFDLYTNFVQLLCCLIVGSFLYSVAESEGDLHHCEVQKSGHNMLLSLASLWVVWNVGFFVVFARLVKQSELERCQLVTADEAANRKSKMSAMLKGNRFSLLSLPAAVADVEQDSDEEDSLSASDSAVRPWAEAQCPQGLRSTQVVSVAFRIWLVRNVDLVKATFECKFRIFLEWHDEDAVGLPKGKKAKLPVPAISITNAVTSEVIDRSSAPEVVNSETGHLAAQILYRATLRMDQQVRLFPFDCQWLALTLSLKDDGCGKNRSFIYQYCEVDEGLALDEWFICPQPAFANMAKEDSPSIQETVMCGVLIRRCARYYVANILLMLGLISSIAFAVYFLDVALFWERAEVFLGIFPLITIFKMSAQGKMPRVGYSTKFDKYASASQVLFISIVIGCMAASFAANVPSWLGSCGDTDTSLDSTEMPRIVERYLSWAFLLVWLAWNAHFVFSAWRAQQLEAVKSLQSPVKIKLQDPTRKRTHGTGPDLYGLAPRLAEAATAEFHSCSRRRASRMLLGSIGAAALESEGKKL